MPAERPKRRSPRLPGYDYSQDGAYFVTICTHQRVLLFGDVLGGEMRLNAAGRIAHEEWLKTPLLRPQVTLDVFVIMPNHVHLLFTLDWEGHLDRDAPRRDVLQYVPTPSPTAEVGEQVGFRSPSQTVGAIIRGFKAATTRQINALRGTPGVPVWQGRYHDHIIRDAKDFEAHQGYILENPARWAEDTDNPACPRFR